MGLNLKDERLHGVGIAEIETINQAKAKDETIKITVSFRGGVKVSLDVPRTVIYPSGAASPFAERQMVYVDFEVNGGAIVKSFGGNTYGANSIEVGRVIEFRPLTKEEKA